MKKFITSFTASVLLFTNIGQVFGNAVIFFHAAEALTTERSDERNGGEKEEQRAGETFALPDIRTIPIVFESGPIRTVEEILQQIVGIDLTQGSLGPVDLSYVDFGVPGDYEALTVLEIPIRGKQNIIIPIRIVDHSVPVITGLFSLTYEVGAIVNEEKFLSDARIKVTDNSTVSITPTVDLSQVHFNTKGVYAATVHATDASGNNALPLVVLVTVGGLQLKAKVSIQAGPPLRSDEILAQSGLDLSGLEFDGELDLSHVDFRTPGVYEARLEARGPAGTVGILLTIDISDAIPPIILGLSTLRYTVGENVNSQQVIADAHIFVADNASGADKIVPTIDISSVDFNQAGIYQATVRAIDAHNNRSLPFVITITILKSFYTLRSSIQVEAGKALTSGEIILGSGFHFDQLQLEAELDLRGVDFDIPGDYEVSTTALDADNLRAARIIITIHVRDTTSPVISGKSVIHYDKGANVSQKQFLQDAEITVTDNSHTPIVPSVDLSTVDFTIDGEYEVIVVATDESGNSTSFVITVQIGLDLIPPVISGEREITYVRGIVRNEAEFFADLNIHVSDHNGEIVKPRVDLSHIHFYRVGTYVAVIEAMNSKGNKAEPFNVFVHIKPVPADLITAVQELSYEAGTWIDKTQFIKDANFEILPLIGVSQTPIVTIDVIDFSSVGVYPVIAKVESLAGKLLSLMVINVTIFDEEPPMIFADREVTYTVGDVVTPEQFIIDAHIKVQDNSGEAEILIDLSHINFDRVGPYVATINAQDNAGNKAVPFQVIVYIVDASVE